LCPGRCDDQSVYGNNWRRDLAADLDAIRRSHPHLLITLNEPGEFRNLGVPAFESLLAASGLPWRHLPIRDGGVPTAAFERAWQIVGSEARAGLRAGRLVVIHCKAGLGRTGMIAARLLAELGMHPQSAIDAVRKARSFRAIETQQERHVLAMGPVND
jgi:protein-tyrosine phosphatase